MTTIKKISGSFLILILFIFLVVFIIAVSPILLIWFICDYIRNWSFKNRYPQFLSSIEGQKFFIYTNRNNSKEYIQSTLLPLMPATINIVEINSKLYVRDFDNWCLSEMIAAVSPKNFPMFFKVTNGNIVSLPINNEFYNTMHQNKDITVLVEKMVRF